MDTQKSLPIAESPQDAAIDPVCGMKVDKSKAKNTLNHDGKTYYFCSRSCLEKFSANPAKFVTHSDTEARYVENQQKSSLDVPKDAFYTCPMHPEVRQRGPGSCPKCGMALEPEAPATLAERTEYTCPMHPEIVRSEPGTCPKCGMALEPRTVVAEVSNPELVDMSRRFWTSAVLTIPLFALAMSRMIFADEIATWIHGRTLSTIEFALATPVRREFAP